MAFQAYTQVELLCPPLRLDPIRACTPQEVAYCGCVDCDYARTGIRLCDPAIGLLASRQRSFHGSKTPDLMSFLAGLHVEPRIAFVITSNPVTLRVNSNLFVGGGLLAAYT